MTSVRAIIQKLKSISWAISAALIKQKKFKR